MALGSVEELLSRLLQPNEFPVATQEGQGEMDDEGNVISIDEEDPLEHLGPRHRSNIDPQEAIKMMLAGDVVKGPMPRTMEDLNNATKPFQGAGGMMSINRAGGVKNPYLDLLDILMYPQGGQIRK